MPTSADGGGNSSGLISDSICHKELFVSQPVILLFAISTTILSIGVSTALVLFIWLAFAHPSAAALILPALIASMATTIATHGGRIADVYKNYRANIADTGAEGAGAGSGEKLGTSDKISLPRTVITDGRK
jgi:hypothetical protein